MNTFETGVFTGAPMGATIGWVIGASHGVPGIVGGSLAGLVLGVVGGLSYACVLMCFVSVMGDLWRAARKDPERGLNAGETRIMSKTARVGIFVGILTASILWRSSGWMQALVGALVVAAIAGIIAVAGYELRQDG